MSARSVLRFPPFLSHVKAATEYLMDVAQLECDMVEAYLFARFQEKKIVVLIVTVSAQEIAVSGIGIGEAELKPFTVERAGFFKVGRKYDDVSDYLR